MDAVSSLLTLHKTSGAVPRTATTSSGVSADFAVALQDTFSQTNAPILAKRKAKQDETETMMKRIEEVGLAKCIEEQNEIKKLNKILELMKLRAAPDVKKKLQEFIDEFKENPPQTADQMLSYMTKSISEIPDDAANEFRKRMEEVLQQIRDMTEMSDEAINHMKQEAAKKDRA